MRLVGLAGERHLEGQLIRRCVQVAPWPRPPWPRPRRRARRRASPPSGTRQLRASGGGGGRARPPRADCSARGARAQRAGQLRLAGVEAGGLMGLVRHRLHYARRKVLPPPPSLLLPLPMSLLYTHSLPRSNRTTRLGSRRRTRAPSAPTSSSSPTPSRLCRCAARPAPSARVRAHAARRRAQAAWCHAGVERERERAARQIPGNLAQVPARPRVGLVRGEGRGVSN